MPELRPDELIERLRGVAIRTTQGSFIRMEDARRLIEEANKQDPEAEVIPYKMGVHRARAMAARHLKEQGMGQKGPREAGTSIPASEPQPPSRA
jgi:hypothetical protein